ncbi:MAG: hypothetical protein RML84_11400 [Anaerolineae bacterium]|nr:hypothetical protein [Anaerolineae bacterium]
MGHKLEVRVNDGYLTYSALVEVPEGTDVEEVLDQVLDHFVAVYDFGDGVRPSEDTPFRLNVLARYVDSTGEHEHEYEYEYEYKDIPRMPRGIRFLQYWIG